MQIIININISVMAADVMLYFPPVFAIFCSQFKTSSSQVIHVMLYCLLYHNGSMFVCQIMETNMKRPIFLLPHLESWHIALFMLIGICWSVCQSRTTLCNL